jgi:hypothetical protein
VNTTLATLTATAALHFKLGRAYSGQRIMEMIWQLQTPKAIK